MAQNETQPAAETTTLDEDGPDEWDQRIFSTGCAEENMRMTNCYYGKRDWRACKHEIVDQMEVFRECWKRNQNDQRTESKDV